MKKKTSKTLQNNPLKNYNEKTKTKKQNKTKQNHKAKHNSKNNGTLEFSYLKGGTFIGCSSSDVSNISFILTMTILFRDLSRHQADCFIHYKCLGYDTKLHLLLMIHFRRSYCHYSEVHSDPQ